MFKYPRCINTKKQVLYTIHIVYRSQSNCHLKIYINSMLKFILQKFRLLFWCLVYFIYQPSIFISSSDYYLFHLSLLYLMVWHPSFIFLLFASLYETCSIVVIFLVSVSSLAYSLIPLTQSSFCHIVWLRYPSPYLLYQHLSSLSR